MPLASGARLGPYEIVAAIGAGGMGEVYRARDTRLDRTVAVKVLSPHIAGSPEFRERFEREARAVAALNHPHICALYDVGSVPAAVVLPGAAGADVPFLVMEHLEGETLAARLDRGSLPADQALRLGIEVASALDRAHHAGIVHRDLKPGNIFLAGARPATGAGPPTRTDQKATAKLLDFGLAKARAAVVDDASGATALAAQSVTARGTILGTFQYMAPEQIEGETADARSDVFALGCVLYEMITGRKAFEGQSPASVMGAILKEEPRPIASLQPLAPRALEHVVSRCLAKDPDERWQSAADLMRELQWVASAAGPEVVSGPTRPRASRSRIAWVAAAAGLGLALGAGVTWMLRTGSEAPAPVPARFVVTLPEGARLAVSVYTAGVAISPDGSRIVFTARQGGVDRLFVRAMDETEAVAVPDTDGAMSPFFSPDGQWIGFASGGKIRKTRVAGGPPIVVCSAAPLVGGAWGPDDTIVFGTASSGLFRVPAGGGTPERLTTLATGERAHRAPMFLPDGRAVLFHTQAISPNIDAVSLVSGERTRILDGGRGPQHSRTGHLVYAADDALAVVPFDAAALKVTGPPVRMPERVTDLAGGVSLSATGSLAFVAELGRLVNELAFVDRRGAVRPLPMPPHVYQQPRLSPDGSRLAVANRDGNLDVWTFDLARGTLSRFTFDRDEDETPAWSPDGRRLVFRSDRANRGVFVKPSDSSAAESLLLAFQDSFHIGSWSPDGRAIAFYSTGPATGEDISIVDVDTRKARRLIETPANETSPAFSPDGRWIAYVSDESGVNEVYVQPYPGAGGKYQISTAGGTEPVWARNGRELFYRGPGKMMAVDIATTPALTAGAPRALFDDDYERGHREHPNYDVTPDGRFLMVRAGAGGEARIIVALDWAAGLAERLRQQGRRPE